MKSAYHIQSYCHIKHGVVSINGSSVYKNSSEEFSVFMKSAYKVLNINYPKFFKMDNLSKLAFLGADVLLEPLNNSEEKENNIAILLSNRASSLDTDRKHQASISDPDYYFPSPSVFVYTLPNICIGEISIKHQLFSENSFFIFDNFNAEHFWVLSNNLLRTNKAEKVLCGWVDFDDNHYEAFLYLVDKKGHTAHSLKEINRLYNTQ